MTADAYAVNLHGNIEALVQRLKTKRYRATLVRRCDIPKANGTERPLGIPALEDKLVQLACAKLLAAIYEQDFLDCRYGYRAGRGALDAVRDLTFDLQYGRYGYLVEADSKGFFEPMDPPWLLDMLRLRIDDRALLHLMRTMAEGRYGGHGWSGRPSRDWDAPRWYGLARPRQCLSALCPGHLV